MKSIITFILLLSCVPLFLIAQVLPDKGVPHLQNFHPQQYLEAGKIWSIQAAPNGIVYMASDKGLLEYDGYTWKLMKGSQGITRSIAVVNDSCIYTGSDMDFGVWKRMQNGNFSYRSLYPFKTEVQEYVEEFWRIHIVSNMVVFIASQNLYVYNDDQITRIKNPIAFQTSFVANGKLYFCDQQTGIYTLDKLSFNKHIEFQNPISHKIIGLFNDNQKQYLVTQDAGILLSTSRGLEAQNGETTELLKEAKVFSFAEIGQQHLAFGTILKGIIITDLKGNVVHQVNKYKGLLSNTVLSLHYAINGKLWLGLDYGATNLFLENDITYFYDYRGDFGTGFDAEVYENDFILATNQGLYKKAWDQLDNSSSFTQFELVEGSEGQVWSLQKHNDNIFVAHDKGLFIYNEHGLHKLNNTHGTWTVLPYGDKLLAGTYNGIAIYEKKNEAWSFAEKMGTVSGSCKQLILQDPTTLWVNIPNYGIVRLTMKDLMLNKQEIFLVEEFEGEEFLLEQRNKQLWLHTDQKKYIFKEQNKKFEESTQSTHYNLPSDILPAAYIPKNLETKYGFYPIYNGFALKHYKNEFLKDKPLPELLIRSAHVFSDSGMLVITNGQKVAHRYNNIRLHFALANYNNVQYQYKLNNGDWSKQTNKNTAEFIQMNAGKHTIEVRARYKDQLSKTSSFSFTIRKPWVKTWPAYLLYISIVVGIALLISYRQRKSLQKQKEAYLVQEQETLKKMSEKHQRTLLLLEQEQMKEQYALLEQQLRNKTVELANKAKDNEDKNRLLITLKDKIEGIQDEPRTSKSKLKEMYRLLSSYIKTDDRTFEIQMDELHQEFFKKLKEKHPSLSSNDLRLCAYIKVGLSSKEIAGILNIQPSSSYIRRSRLRKKLNLKTEDDLYDFLNKI